MGLWYRKTNYLHDIPAVPKKSMILTRLGYRRGTTELDEGYARMLREGIRLGGILCRPAGAYARLKIVEGAAATVRLENGAEFRSEGLAGLLSGCDEALLMASTVGAEVVGRILREVEKGEAAMGLILDSVASQTADAVLGWMMDFINRGLAREGRTLTRHRYSPGFGDLHLSYQKVIFETLALHKLDIKLTEKFMLVPEKSALAVAGVKARGEVL